jgi:hypothetical protein
MQPSSVMLLTASKAGQQQNHRQQLALTVVPQLCDEDQQPSTLAPME